MTRKSCEEEAKEIMQEVNDTGYIDPIADALEAKDKALEAERKLSDELAEGLKAIRDKDCKNLNDIAIEPDKVVCVSGNISFAVSVLIAKHKERRNAEQNDR